MGSQISKTYLQTISKNTQSKVCQSKKATKAEVKSTHSESSWDSSTSATNISQESPILYWNFIFLGIKL